MKPEPPLKPAAAAPRLWLILDYDGTLADFASTPDTVIPDPALIELLSGLSKLPQTKLAVVSGRRLEHIRNLVPVPGVILAGTYGLEIQWADGRIEHQLKLFEVRPFLEALKPRWEALLAKHAGFYLEDKNWSLAIHARAPDPQDVLGQAQALAVEAGPGDLFAVQRDGPFLEVRPRAATKAMTVRLIWEQDFQDNATPVMLGDDNKDEAAFAVVNELGGMTVQVRDQLKSSRAQYRLASPTQARAWLANLLELRKRFLATEP